MEQIKTQVLILGSGPAGLTAAIYTSRANLKPLLLHGPLPWGQLSTTTDVENFPGFESGIMGPDLMDVMEKQAKRFGTEVMIDLATEVDLNAKPIQIKTQSGKEILADTLIIATGANARLLGLNGEKELMGFGLSTCATCDGAFFRDVPIAVVGGGDSACEEANFLTRFGSKVYMIHRRAELRASKIMQERVLNNPKIEMVWDSGVSELKGIEDKKLSGIIVKNTKTAEEKTIDVSALFIAIGHTPNTELFAGQLEVDENNYLLTKADSTETKLAGVFACGDVKDHVYRQAVTAAGSGCMAAIEAERWLEGQES